MTSLEMISTMLKGGHEPPMRIGLYNYDNDNFEWNASKGSGKFPDALTDFTRVPIGTDRTSPLSIE